MADRTFTAVALAGGTLESDFRGAGYEVANKAYLPVAGELMLIRVLRALRNAGSVKQIRCVTQRAAAQHVPAVAQLSDAIIEPGTDLISSVLAGFDGLGHDERVLVVATDLPLLTSKAVDDFAEVIARTPCDLGYGFVERGVHNQAYAAVRHTWVHLREGTFCGAGVSMIRAGAAPVVQGVLRDFTSVRKSPAKMASLFSPLLVLRILFGRVGVAELEQRASTLTGLLCRGILCPDPEVAVNVDRITDLRTIERILQG